MALLIIGTLVSLYILLCLFAFFDNREEVSLVGPGMAGSGKTTFVQRLASHLSSKKRSGYLLNLDPAVAKVPYNPNIDIRDTVRFEPCTISAGADRQTRRERGLSVCADSLQKRHEGV